MNGSDYSTLDALRPAVLGCRRCRLRDGARGVVFGEGSPTARIVFCGEGPGAEEDRQLRPFVGPAGQLLDRMMAAMGFDRTRNAYILNVVKCRPPGNRQPTADERAECLPHLTAQLAILRPAVMVLLGATAVQALVADTARVSRVRGHWQRIGDIWAMPTYHPAALLRNPGWKRDAWDDLKQVIDKYREIVDPDHLAPAYPVSPPKSGPNRL